MVNGISTTTTTSNSTTNSTNPSVMGKDEFLNLLVTQLKYQDPLNPMDGANFASQLAQFSSLEQLTNINDSLQTSINGNYYLTQSINNTMTATLVGKDIKLAGGAFTKNGQEDVELGYTLPVSPSSIEVNVLDENGNIVKTFDSPPSEVGDNKLIWDFTDNNGRTVPDGTYTFEVNATNSSGEEMTLTLFKWGKIDGVRFTENGTTLVVNGNEYLLSDVLEILDSSQND